MRLRAGRLLLALGGLLGLFVVLPLAVMHESSFPKGTFDLVAAAAALLCLGVAWLRPDLAPKVLGTSAATSLVLTLALVCLAFPYLHLAPESAAHLVRWVGFGLIASVAIYHRVRRGSQASTGG